MKILALNATYRPGKTTTQLSEKALEGAASLGADTEMLFLKEADIQYCGNCLSCYRDMESEIAPCVIDDDMGSILEKIRDADGIILSSPVHNGFITGLMTVFFERAIWRLCRPSGELMGLKGCPEPRLTKKPRAIATIVSAGMVPPELREACDQGTPWLKEMATLCFNGQCIGDQYAGAFFPKPLNDEEWSRAYFIRELTDAQLQESYNLGVTVAEAIKSGNVSPYDPSLLMPDGGNGAQA